MSDVVYMQRALELAKQARGATGINPLVGAVIVRNDNIVAEGFHRFYGGDHAEVDAIKKANDSLVDSTLYVTLEPCIHFGKTPPCTKAIIKAGINKVVFAMTDPNPQIAGKGMEELQQAGLIVEKGVCADEAHKLNEAYIKYVETGRPFVTVKIAQTLDGKVADFTGDSKWITSAESRQLVHQMRAEHDAILIGAGTLHKDNPSLTTHEIEGQNPLRIIIAGGSEVNRSLQAFNHQDNIATILAVPKTAEDNDNENIWQLPASNGRVDLEALLDKVGQSKISSLLVEGGSQVFTQFIEQKLVDRLIIVLAPRLLGGGVRMFDPSNPLTVTSTKDFSVERSYQTGEDIWIEMRSK